MGVNDILAIVTAIGGFEGLKWAVQWFLNRKTNKRKEEASVEAVENANERTQIDWYEERLKERDKKIDTLYLEFRNVQAKYLDEVFKRHEVELELKEAKVKRCDIHGCGGRQPPSDY